MKKILLTLTMCLFATFSFAQVVDVPEVIAEYPGGLNAMMGFMQKTLKYPADCEKAGIEGF